MSPLVKMMTFVLCVMGSIVTGLSLRGNKCGQKVCNTTEYCSRFDTQCKPCSTICNPEDHNHQPEDCLKDCQEYVYDQRYALREELSQYEELREVNRLRILLGVTLTLTCLAIMVIVYLLIRTFVRCNKIGNAIRNVFSKKWVKKATNNNKVQDDVETGGNNVNKQNGLKLSMPTISATVTSSQDTSNSNGTPNTTSTPLSRRHPSEDTTLDYAYDNPAMTPSPEAAQLRTKRESSF
ncbi:protein grindelwald-like isoform X2 [Vespa mandarinia]|uniref:protein grindelwald-like isoform X2 n=1 Tax=Vespa mandarinia TaxID=7446 RepID=UPI001617A9B3|nr:protein grindelwald-like isoform X2 [Vespa mandarinia]